MTLNKNIFNKLNEYTYRDSEGELGDGTSFELDYFNRIKRRLKDELPDVEAKIVHPSMTHPESRRARFILGDRILLEIPFELMDIDKIMAKLKSKVINEGIFSRISGPKRKTADKYVDAIRRNLFPKLKEQGIEMSVSPLTLKPNQVTFAGTLEGKQLRLTFVSSYTDDEEFAGKEDNLFCKLSYNNQAVDVGYIDVDKQSSNAAEMIMTALSENGYKKEEPEEDKEQETTEDNNTENQETYEKEASMELPPKDLLDHSEKQSNNDDVEGTSSMLEQTLEDFGIYAQVVDTHVGPAFTQFELTLRAGTKVNEVSSLSKEISLALSAKNVRIEAPIPGKNTIGIEIPNQQVGIVNLADIVENTQPETLSTAIGVDTNGTPHSYDITKMQHLLVGGSTGSGKSAFINSMITSILMNYKPSQVKFIMIDPKRVELNQYSGIPHLLMPIVTDPQEAAGVLEKLVAEMDNRYRQLEQAKVKNIADYNKKAQQSGVRPMFYIVCVIDELADLMMTAGKSVEASIKRITQLARAAGIHLIVATQRPSADIVTGDIKTNIPSRVSFATSSNVDSRIILDQGGAEKLLGKGDMLFKPSGATQPMRLQGAFTTDEEVERVVNFYKAQEK